MVPIKMVFLIHDEKNNQVYKVLLIQIDYDIIVLENLLHLAQYHLHNDHILLNNFLFKNQI